MKTYKQFLTEAKPPKPDAPQTMAKNWERKYPGLKFGFYPSHGDTTRVDTLRVPEDQRGQGIATRTMKAAQKVAARQNKRVTLTPQAEQGYKKKLDTFYKRLGFKSNKGRNKDYSVSDTMIYDPKSKRD
jgi:GNAT superfamily N-acetyltransferase